ncbi:MAG: extracellular solute-binding protein [Anaerolineae bacterium]|nr:extracellular solute-binding protein [Anaerolineae bacterium]
MKHTLSADIRLRRDALRHAGPPGDFIAGRMALRPIHGADTSRRARDVARFTGRSWRWPGTSNPGVQPQRPARRGVARAVMLALLLTLLAACAAPTPTPEPVSIRFVLPAADVDATKGLVEQFRKANPNVQVELVGRRWDPLTGIDPSGADVLLTSQFALDELRRRGALVSLDALMAGDKELNQADFLPNALKMFVDSGKTWALPAGLDPQVVYFNKDFFDRRGVPYPTADWTRDDFLQKVLKLRDPATGVFGYAINSDFLDPILFVYQHGGRLFDDLQNPTRTTFTDPKTIEAVEWYARLLKEEGAVLTPQVAQNLGMGNLQNALRAGKSAMWIGPLSARGGRFDRAPWPMKWGMAPLPRDAAAATMATATGYAITTQCKKSLACWQFIAFLSKHAPGSFAPARRSLVKSAAGQDAEVAQIAQAAVDSSLMIRAADLASLSKAIDLFTAAVGEVVSGKASAAEALAAAQRGSPLR